MDVHDTPSISRAIDCVPGVVITVEPGIYIRPENTAVRDEFRGKFAKFFYKTHTLLQDLVFVLKIMFS
jgi:Xaa-Pro aminopeptidase